MTAPSTILNRYGLEDLRQAFSSRLRSELERNTFKLNRSALVPGYDVALYDKAECILDARLCAVSEAQDDSLFDDMVEFILERLRKTNMGTQPAYSRIRAEAELFDCLRGILEAVFTAAGWDEYEASLRAAMPEFFPERREDWTSQHYTAASERMKESIIAELRAAAEFSAGESK